MIEIVGGGWLGNKYLLDYLSLKILRVLLSSHQSLLFNLDEHSYDLSKKIIVCYCCLRLKHHAKLENEKIKIKESDPNFPNLYYLITSSYVKVL